MSRSITNDFVKISPGPGRTCGAAFLSSGPTSGKRGLTPELDPEPWPGACRLDVISQHGAVLVMEF